MRRKKKNQKFPIPNSWLLYLSTTIEYSVMAITTDDIKALRGKTGISVMQCKRALEEAGGDMEKAFVILRKKSGAAAAQKAERILKSGAVASYIHAGGAVGAMVELLCETDFVGRNEEFRKLAYEIAMQVAATAPEFLESRDIRDEDTRTAREVFEKEAEDKPADIQKKIIEGKLLSYFKEKVLLTQSYIKDPEKTVEDLVKEATQKFGERIEIGRFSRFSLN